jgi:hypothetical protein
MELWLRHPFRMLRFHFGCCPICNSSPPEVNCPVCYGTYEYGPKLTSELRAEWLKRWVWVLSE